MRAHRLKTYIWVQVQQRICEQNSLPFYILQKGNLNAGAVILKINAPDRRCNVFSQITMSNGEAAWQSLSTKGETVFEFEADKYIEKQIQIDPDVWVVEINDMKGIYNLEGMVI